MSSVISDPRPFLFPGQRSAPVRIGPITQRGLTLLELAVVLFILIALAGLSTPYLAGESLRTACIATDASLAGVREAITGGSAGTGYLNDLGDLPHYTDTSGVRHDTLHFLFSDRIIIGADTFTANDRSLASLPFNPVTGRGWRGPYLQGGMVNAGIAVVRDAWPARAAVDLQIPVQDADGNSVNDCLDRGYASPNDCARLVSAGPDGIFQTTLTDLDAAARNDDRILFLRMADPVGNANCS